MRNPKAFLPSLFTVMNLFSGFYSIINASNGEIEKACMFIIYAALFDAFDGIVARFTGTSSRLGIELDSLADVVSFGAAPSYLLYKVHFYDIGGLGIAVSSLLLIFGALRLARFNANLVGFDKNYFTGVPVPLTAITISSFFLFYYNDILGSAASNYTVLALAFVLPVLNMSKLKYETTPKFSARAIKEQPVKFAITVTAIIIVFATKGIGLFPFALFYLSTGVVRSLYLQIVKTLSKRQAERIPHRQNPEDIIE